MDTLSLQKQMGFWKQKKFSMWEISKTELKVLITKLWSFQAWTNTNLSWDETMVSFDAIAGLTKPIASFDVDAELGYPNSLKQRLS